MQGIKDLNSHWDTVIDAYFDAKKITYDDLSRKSVAEMVKRDILDQVATNVKLDNAARDKDSKIYVPRSLDLHAVVRILVNTGDIATTETVPGGGRIIIVRHHVGDMAGIWEMDGSPKPHGIRRIADMLGLDDRQKSLLPDSITDIAPCISCANDPSVVPLRNGVYDLRTGDFTPYVTDDGKENPDYVAKYGSMVMTRKNNALWDPDAQDTELVGPDGLTWSVEQHLHDVFGGNEAAEKIFWCACNFALRGISGGRTLWFMDSSENGSGGGAKSTTAAMIGAIVGRKYTAMINVDTLQGRFGLAGIIGKTLIIGNESNAGAKSIDNAAAIKSLMRNEPVIIDRKGKDIIEYNFTGLMIQCYNCASPRFADKTGSFYRKICAIPFGAKLGGSTERKYIADDMIYRDSVTSYIARKAMSLGNIDRYDTDALAALDDQIVAIRAAGSTVYSFCEIYMPTISGEMIPLPAFYSAYGRWCEDNGYKGCSASSFEADLQQWISNGHDSDFSLDGAKRGDSPKRLPRSAPPEQFLAECGTADWRRDINLRNTSMEEGAGEWSTSKYRTTVRKWIAKKSTTRTDINDIPYDRMLQDYRTFASQWIDAHLRWDYGQHDAQDAAKGMPSMQEWIDLGRPRARYTDNPNSPGGYSIPGWESVDKQVTYSIDFGHVCSACVVTL